MAMKSIMLTQWQRLAIEAGLRELISSQTHALTRVHDAHLKTLRNIMETATFVRVTYEPD